MERPVDRGSRRRERPGHRSDGTALSPEREPVADLCKTSRVVADQIDGTTQPKRVPGRALRNTLTVANTGSGTVDASAVSIADPVPANADLYVALAGPPVTIANG